jgi:plastocyanin
LLTAPAASANPNTITIQNFAYTGLDAARANTTWSISNRDTVAHTVSADDGSFAWRVEPGQTTPFAKTLGPGSYAIHCDVHPNAMRGVLVVS